MNLEEFAKSVAANVVDDLEARGHAIGAELRDRVTSAAEMATLVFLNGAAGVDQAQELRLLESRMQSLAAAGASAIALAITDNIRRIALKGIGLLAGL